MDGDPFREVNDDDLRAEDGMPLMPTGGVRYVAVQDFRIGRAVYLTDEGSGETIVVQLIIDNLGQMMAGNFAISDDVAVGIFAVLGLTLIDRGIGVPDVVAGHRAITDELETFQRLEDQFDPDANGDG